MPTLTARTFAEMINMPAYEQGRILHEQKYPQDQSNVFKIPFYQPALAGIRNYYRSGNDIIEIKNAIIQSQNVGLQARSKHNIRVLNSFQKGSQKNRILNISRTHSIFANPHQNVKLKLHFDLEAFENNKEIRIFYNFRNVPIDKIIAESTIQVAYWVLQQNQLPLRISQIELIDFNNGKIYKISRPSLRIQRVILQNANIVDALWNRI